MNSKFVKTKLGDYNSEALKVLQRITKIKKIII